MGLAAILALDAGTSSAKALLVARDSGAVLARASVPIALQTPAPGSVEQDPVALADAVVAAGAQVLAARPDARPVALALSNQRESVVAWDSRTGQPLGPLLSWQDARMARWVAALPDDVAAVVRDRTGLTLDAMYSAPKMRWLIDNADPLPPALRIGTVDAWLVHCLTGEWAIEAGNASRTLLLNLATGDWDEDLLAVFGIPRSVLPDVRASDGGFGSTAGVSGIPDDVPVVAVLADSHAALFAHGSRGPGIAKATYGTGTSVMVPVEDPSAAVPGVDTTIAWWTSAPQYAREGNILSTGQAIDWTAAVLAGESAAPGGAVLAELAAAVPDTGGVAFVPAFTGLGSPYWDRGARAVMTGMTLGTTRGHIARAALDAVAQQVADLIEAVSADDDGRITSLHVDGGASSVDMLVQMQADLLGVPVVRSREPALSALGSAHLAAQAIGAPLPSIALDDAAEPRLDAADRAKARATWRQAVSRSRSALVPTQPQEDA